MTLEAVETLPLEGVGMAKGDAVGIQAIPLNKIKLAKNSRMSVSSEELDGLMLSIKSVGLLQPIGVVKSGTGFEVCYGNRRFLACSKLGLSKIAAVVHTNKREFDRDIKNLTENIQRRNLSLAECGRYIEILSKEGLSTRECAARLGVSISYVKGCQAAYELVPKEFRDDLEIKVSSEKLAPGKISIKTAQAIISAKKTYRLTDEQMRPLFKAAKESDQFVVENVPKYAAAIKAGKPDFLSTVKKIKFMRLNFTITEDHFEELEEKYVTNGPFKTVQQLCIAILKGEKSVKINVKGRY